MSVEGSPKRQSSPSGVDDLDYFQLLDEALKEEGIVKHVVETSSAEDPMVIYLDNGDVHVCDGKCCPLELNADKCYVCMHSGVVVAPQQIRDDFSTGRQAGSANPDDKGGTPLGGTWKQKKDIVGLSQSAFLLAKTVDSDEPGELYKKVKPSEEPRKEKRGARCVDELVDLDEVEAKRTRSQKTVGETTEQMDHLLADAQNVMRKLINFEKREKKTRRTKSDEQLINPDQLFVVATKKYVRDCLTANIRPNFDTIHNLGLTAHKIAAAQRKRAEVAEGQSALMLKVTMRHQVAALAVTLWRASTQTNYMKTARRGADSFRPFVSGVLYALKRGIKLPDGSPVIPEAPELAAALPALRMTQHNSAAKALHASSHRGLCTLHRSIASCSGTEASKLYCDAVLQCAQLSHAISTGHYDL